MMLLQISLFLQITFILLLHPLIKHLNLATSSNLPIQSDATQPTSTEQPNQYSTYSKQPSYSTTSKFPLLIPILMIHLLLLLLLLKVLVIPLFILCRLIQSLVLLKRKSMLQKCFLLIIFLDEPTSLPKPQN